MPAAFECPLDEGLAKYDAAADQAEADVIRSGLGVASRPTINNAPAERPDLPPDLSKLGLAELSYLLGVLTQWHTYATGQKTIAGVRRKVAADKKAFAWRYIRRLKEGTVADKDDAAGIDIRYIEVETQYNFYDAKYEFLCGAVESLKREVETVSRAVELLKQRIESESREIGVSRRVGGVYNPSHSAISALFRQDMKKR